MHGSKLLFSCLSPVWLGSLAAIGQQSIKRLMAYSSIGHIGFALVGFAPSQEITAQKA